MGSESQKGSRVYLIRRRRSAAHQRSRQLDGGDFVKFRRTFLFVTVLLLTYPIKPGTFQGKPVDVRILLLFNFKLY